MDHERRRQATRTQSAFWWQADVTRLIAQSRTDIAARNQLAELVYRPAFHRLDRWLRATGLARLNIEADDLFDNLWHRDIVTAITAVDFSDREHFLRTVLLRCRQAAQRTARQFRRGLAQKLPAYPAGLPGSRDPAVIAEYAELIAVALRKMRRIPHPGNDILKLHFIEGMTIRQIASELNLPPSTVHLEMKRALQTLRDAIQ